MATLNYLPSDWLKCGLLCFGGPPVPKCSIDVCCVRRTSFVTVFSECGPRGDANDLSQKGKIVLEPRRFAQCTFKPLAPTATTYDSVNSTQTHFSNQRAIKKKWENYIVEVFWALGRGSKNPQNVWLNVCANTTGQFPMRCIWQEAEELSALFQFCLLGSLHLWRVAVELTPCSRLPDSETDSEVTAGVTAPRPGNGRLQSHSCDSFIPVLIPVMRDANVIKSWDRNDSSTSFLLRRRNFLFLFFSFSLPESLDDVSTWADSSPFGFAAILTFLQF